MNRLDVLVGDVRIAARLLWKSPAFTTAAVLTIALGVGVNTAVFSVVNAFMLRPLPVRDATRLVVIASRPSIGPLGGVSYPGLQDYRAATAGTFEDAAGYSVGFVGLAPEGGRPERVLATWVTGNYFPLLDLHPAAGRLIRADEGGPGRVDAVVVLGYAAWQRRFDGERSIVGRIVLVNGRSCTIVGVAPPGFAGTFAFSESEIYLPLNWSGDAELGRRDVRWLHALARLRPSVTIEAARATMNVVSARLGQEYPDTDRGVALEVLPEPLARPEEDNARSNARGATVMLVLVGLVLAVAGVNVTNLLFVRATGRRRELAIRTALGAGRLRLVRQLLTESLMLAALGGVAGVVLGGWTARALATIRLPGDLPVRFDFHLDWRVLAYATAATLVTGLFVGLMPAVRGSRADLTEVLKQGVHAGPSGAGRVRLRRTLVVVQIAACFLLLAAAGLFARSLTQSNRVDLGFRPDGVLNVHMDAGPLGYTESQGRALFDDIERRVRGIPGVEDVSFAFTIPMGYVSVLHTLHVEGGTTTVDQRPTAGVNVVSPQYFATMGIPIVGGRSFTAGDTGQSPPVAIVNQRLADLLWPGRDPIGRRFSAVGSQGRWMEVVGMTATGKCRFLFEGPQAYYYAPIAQHYTPLRVLQIRTSLPAETLAGTIEQIVHEREPRLLLYDVQSMRRALGGGYGFFLVRTGAISAASFGILGLALACVGLYGVVSYMASQRAHEIGVRLALGATSRDVLRLVLGDGLGLITLGLAVGLVTAVGCSGFLDRFLFGVSARDPLTYAGVAPMLAAVTLSACVIPAWRAARADPMMALRQE